MESPEGDAAVGGVLGLELVLGQGYLGRFAPPFFRLRFLGAFLRLPPVGFLVAIGCDSFPNLETRQQRGAAGQL